MLRDSALIFYHRKNADECIISSELCQRTTATKNSQQEGLFFFLNLHEFAITIPKKNAIGWVSTTYYLCCYILQNEMGTKVVNA